MTNIQVTRNILIACEAGIWVNLWGKYILSILTSGMSEIINLCFSLKRVFWSRFQLCLPPMNWMRQNWRLKKPPFTNLWWEGELPMISQLSNISQWPIPSPYLTICLSVVWDRWLGKAEPFDSAMGSKSLAFNKQHLSLKLSPWPKWLPLNTIRRIFSLENASGWSESDPLECGYSAPQIGRKSAAQ